MPNLSKLVKSLAVTSVIGVTPLAFASTAAATPGSPANTQALMSVLSHGYGPSNCSAGADLTQDALAVVDYKQNTLQGGPGGARYILYPDATALANHFSAIIADDATFPCAANEPAPQSWHYNSSPDVAAGEVSCGTYKGRPELVWSNIGKLVMASAQGPDINGMYSWWLQNG
jgi:serine/threonine kinase PknH